MLRIDWRSPAAYEHTKRIPAAGFAWEYLRRNDEYRLDFQTIALTGEPEGRKLEVFAERWGLRFSKRSRRVACSPYPSMVAAASAAGGHALARRA